MDKLKIRLGTPSKTIYVDVEDASVYMTDGIFDFRPDKAGYELIEKVESKLEKNYEWETISSVEVCKRYGKLKITGDLGKGQGIVVTTLELERDVCYIASDYFLLENKDELKLLNIVQKQYIEEMGLTLDWIPVTKIEVL